MPKPLVSVVTIFLNAEQFLEEAIQSVFAQTYQNWELLLVDDGSTDRSTALALDYARRYADRVRYLEHGDHANRGMSASRNLGIRRSNGEYIAFLDSDDTWLPEKLECQVEILESRPQTGMTFGPAVIWRSWSGNPNLQDRYSDPKVFGAPPDVVVEPPGLLPTLVGKEGACPAPSSVLVRRAVIERVQGFEDAFREDFEDQAFYAKVYLTTPVYVENKHLTKYRQHPNSCTAIQARNGSREKAELRFFDWFFQHMKSAQVTDPTLWRAARWRVWALLHPTLYSLRPANLPRLTKRLRGFLRAAVPSGLRQRLRR